MSASYYIVLCDNPNVQYSVDIEIPTEHVVRVHNMHKFNCGFYLYSSYGYCVGDYSKYTTDFETPNLEPNTYDYSDNGSKWVNVYGQPPQDEPSEEDRIQAVINQNMEQLKPKLEEMQDLLYAMYLVINETDLQEPSEEPPIDSGDNGGNAT